MNGKTIPHSQTAKYLGTTLDAKLCWKLRVKKKREELRLRYRQMYWLLGRRSALTTHNKLVLYKQILKPVWHPAMGVHKTEQHCCDSAIPKQGTQGQC
jgi:hypothetical protein